MAKKKIIGYTAGTYDLFHIGHLNILKNAKRYCDYLIVAVSTDELVNDYKKHFPVISFQDRCAIVESIRYVDKVVPQKDMNKLRAAQKYNIDIMLVGDDWKGTEKWNNIEKELALVGVKVVYLPHTDSISSTLIKEKICEKK